MTKEEYIQDCWRKAKEYCEGVEDGSIITCENLKLAVKQHQDDLLRDDLEWKPEMVERVFRFFSYLNVAENQRFILEPYQAFTILFLFGHYYKGTDERKYQFAFLFVGRKNGKTTFVAALQLYFMMADGQPFPRSLLISASQDNAIDTSFGALQELIKWSPSIRNRLIARRSNKIEFIDNSKLGWCKTVPIDNLGKLEGYNPTSCILDEIHTYKDAQKFNVIKNGLGTKKNPMLFLISTGGYDQDSFCVKLVQTGREVLRGKVKDDRFAFLLYELDEGDDPHDEKNWIKVNPALGGILSERDFKSNYETSKNIPESLNDWLTKRMNLFLEEQSEWIPSHIIKKATRKFTDEEVKGLPCYIGGDLSETRDLTSFTLLWVGNDKYYIRTYFFFVKLNSSNSLKKGHKDILLWTKLGYVIPCETDTIDYELIKRYIKEWKSSYNVKGIYFDPYRFPDFLNVAKTSKGAHLKFDDNSTVWCSPMPQGFALDQPMRELERLLFSDKIEIYPNDCLRWNFLNVLVERDRVNGNIRPKKNKNLDAIDGVISTLCALGGYLGVGQTIAAKFYEKYKQ